MDFIGILGKVISAAPGSVIPFLIIAAVICYLSFKIYQEFKRVYKTINDKEKATLERVSKCESTVAKADERTLLLQKRLDNIEANLERINSSLIEVSTTLKIMREDRNEDKR